MRKSIGRSCSVFLFTLLFIGIINNASATSGCGSWHGGVDSCDTSTGRQVCNDGSYSPSCTCEYIPPKEKVIPLQIEKQNINNEWCGAGKLFKNADDAEKSIEDLNTQIIQVTEKPLKDDIEKLQKENDDLKSELEKNNNARGWSLWGWSVIRDNN